MKIKLKSGYVQHLFQYSIVILLIITIQFMFYINKDHFLYLSNYENGSKFIRNNGNTLNSFRQTIVQFPWEDYSNAVESKDENKSLEYSQLFLETLEPFAYLEPNIPIHETCKKPPKLTSPNELNCEKYPNVFLNNNNKLNKPRKIYHAVQLGFDADILEIMLHEIYDLVDAFFIIESTAAHCKFIKKSLAWDKIKFQPRFRPFSKKIVHLILDDVDVLKSSFEVYQKGPIWRLEFFQERLRWHKMVEWNNLSNNIFQPDDLLGFGDTDEIPSRHNLELLRYCKLRKPDRPIDIGIWFPFGRINQLYKSDFPVDKDQNFTLGDPTYYPVHTLLSSIDPKTNTSKMLQDTVSRNRGRSNNFLLGGMHMTYYGYLPFLLLKILTQTECELSDYKTMIQRFKDFSDTSIYEIEKLYSKVPKAYMKGISIIDKDVPFESVKDVVVFPWFYNCNRKRYPAWEGLHDKRLE